LAVLREHALFNVFNNHALRGSSSLVGNLKYHTLLDLS
jgi:hypothetical protein